MTTEPLLWERLSSLEHEVDRHRRVINQLVARKIISEQSLEQVALEQQLDDYRKRLNRSQQRMRELKQNKGTLLIWQEEMFVQRMLRQEINNIRQKLSHIFNIW